MSAAPLITIEQFHAERRSGLGGSDIGGILNVDPFKCPRAIGYAKLGTEPDRPEDPDETNGNIERGIRGEEIAVEQYERQSGRRTLRRSVRRHRQHPEFMVHQDRAIVSNDDERGPGTLEAKCPNWFTFRRIRYEGLPPAYILQLQWAMFVTGYKWGAFVVGHLDSWKFPYFEMDRDDSLINRALAGAQEFWSGIENGVLPPRLDPSQPDVKDGQVTTGGAKRCSRCAYRQRCQGERLLDAIKDSGTVVPIKAEDAHLDALAADYLEWQELESEAKEGKEAARNRLAAAVPNGTIVETGAHRIYHTSYPRRGYTVQATTITSVRVYGV